jgi:hypothetical protein
MITVYLSSTYEDLKEYREAVKLKALHESGDERIVLQDYPAANYRPRTMGLHFRGGSRLGTRSEAGDQCVVGGCSRLHKVVVRANWKTLSIAFRSGVGICSAGGNEQRILVGREYWQRAGELQRLRQSVGQ